MICVWSLIYSVWDYVNLNVVPILLKTFLKTYFKKFFLFLCSPYLLLVLCFEFNVNSDKFTMIIIMIGIDTFGICNLVLTSKTICKNTRTVYRKHDFREVLSSKNEEKSQREKVYEKQSNNNIS